MSDFAREVVATLNELTKKFAQHSKKLLELGEEALVVELVKSYADLLNSLKVWLMLPKKNGLNKNQKSG